MLNPYFPIFFHGFPMVLLFPDRKWRGPRSWHRRPGVSSRRRWSTNFRRPWWGRCGSSCRWPFLGPGDDESMRILRRFLRDGIAMDPNDPYMAGWIGSYKGCLYMLWILPCNYIWDEVILDDTVIDLDRCPQPIINPLSCGQLTYRWGTWEQKR